MLSFSFLIFIFEELFSEILKKTCITFAFVEFFENLFCFVFSFVMLGVKSFQDTASFPNRETVCLGWRGMVLSVFPPAPFFLPELSLFLPLLLYYKITKIVRAL